MADQNNSNVKKLYKFIMDDETALYKTLQGEIKFTPTPELNDPLEMYSAFDLKIVSNSLSELRKRLLTDEEFSWLKKQEILLKKLAPKMRKIQSPETKESYREIIRSSIYDQYEYLESMMAETRDIILRNTGVFCLSETFYFDDVHLMWAHYASKAKGFAIEFTGLENIFIPDDTGIMGGLFKVKYAKRSGLLSFYPDSHKNLFFTKTLPWNYENEYRVVKALSDCTKKNTNNGETIYLYQINPKCITKVYAGWMVSTEKIATIRKGLADRGLDVPVVKLEILDGEIRHCLE